MVAQPDTVDTPRAPSLLPARTRIVLACSCFLLAATLSPWVDLPTAHWFHRHDLRGDLGKVVTYAEVFGHGFGAALMILTAVVLDRRGWRLGVELATQAFGAGLLANSIKLVVGRVRPYCLASWDLSSAETFCGWFPAWNMPDYDGWFDTRYASFPSGHAATAAGLALGFVYLYPRGWWLFPAFALLAGVQRCYTEAHFVSDVLVGFGIGCLVAGCWQALRPRRW